MVDQSRIQVLVFLTNFVIVHYGLDALVSALNGKEFVIIRLLDLLRGLCLRPALERADIGKLNGSKGTFMLMMRLRWRSLTRSNSFLWTTRFTMGIYLFII